VLSIVFWTLTVIVSLKYVTLVLRADNHGEGGLVAMLALASQSVKDRPKLRRWLLIVGIFGTCLFYGDGVITPAISVLSAVEGLEVISPALQEGGHSHDPGHSVLPVHGAKAWHGGHWQVFWTHHGGVVHHHCGVGRVAHR
jgi:K+ transporter